MASGKLKGFFAGGSSSSSSEESYIPPRDTETSSSAVPAPSSAPTEKNPLPKDLDTIPLNLTVTFPSIPPMTVAEKRKARSRYEINFNNLRCRVLTG